MKNTQLDPEYYIPLNTQSINCQLHGLAVTRTIFDRYCMGSNSAVVMLLCPWERHFAILSFAWRFNKQYQITNICIAIKKKKSDSNILVSPKAGQGNSFIMYSASVVFLQVRRINREHNTTQSHKCIIVCTKGTLAWRNFTFYNLLNYITINIVHTNPDLPIKV